MPSDNEADKELMGYFVIHAKTDCALFHVNHVRRMFELAGGDQPVFPAGRGSWFSIHYDVWKDEIDRAYAKAFTKEGTPDAKSSEA